MILTTSIAAEAGETGAPDSTVRGKIAIADARFILEMYRSIYDETDPKQDTNAAGELLFLDAAGAVVTQTEVDAAPSRTVFRPKFRPRTLKEVHVKLVTTWTHSIWAVARARKLELDRRAVSAAPEKLPAVAL